MAKKRITELTEATTVKPGHYIPVDHGTDGTQKMSMSTLIDSTLTTSGKAADAKATGDSITELDARMDTFTSLPSGSTSGDAELMDIRVGADGTTYQSAGSAVRGQISEIKQDLQEIIDGGGGSGMTEEFKHALHNILEQLVYISADGQTYLDALDNALWPPTNLVSISAVFTQGQNVIYDTDSLDTLKQYLVVTAHYSDSSTAIVTAYVLSGTLTAGTSTITVLYGGKTDTFTVTVTENYNSVSWEIGSINGTTGELTDVTNRLRTDFIPVTGNSDYLMVGNSLQFIIRCYDSNKQFVGAISDSTSSGWFAKYHATITQGSYIRIVMRKSSDADFSEGEVDGDVISVNSEIYYLDAPKYPTEEIKVYNGKGVSGTSIVDNPNRALSGEFDVSDFSAPVFTARITTEEEPSLIQFALKYIDSNGDVITSYNMYGSPLNPGSGADFGILPNRPLALMSTGAANFVPASIPSGAVKMRLLFANQARTQLDSAPTGMFIINNRRYKLTEGTTFE